MYFFYFVEKGMALLLNKFPFINDACAKFGWNWSGGSWEVVNVFLLFCNYLPLKRAWDFIWTNLNPLYTRMLCAKFGWNAQWFLRKRFLNFVNIYSLFRNYLPLEKDVTLYLNKLESSSPKDALCQVWLE